LRQQEIRARKYSILKPTRACHAQAGSKSPQAVSIDIDHVEARI
jgi:hypothetical protein